MRIFRNRHMRWPWLTTLGYNRKTIMGFRWYGRAGLILLVVMALVSARSGGQSHQISDVDVVAGRRLLSSGTTTPTVDCSLIDNHAQQHGFSWEQCSFEEAHVKQVWVVIHGIAIFIIFVALAIICDDFFVPSLEAISEKLRLSEDVAGATFMAAGSSAPELFTSVVGVAFETDVGVGTIVGSAVFNILIIIALTTALAGQVLSLDWRPMFRDSLYYAMSIALFIVFAWDGVIELYESIILLVLYILYIVVMFFNQKLMELLGSFQRSSIVEPTVNGNVESSETTTTASVTTVPGKKMSMTGGHARRLSVLSHRSSLHDLQSERDKHVFHHTHHGAIAGNFTNEPEHHNDEDEDEPSIKLVPCLPAVRTSCPPRPEKGVATCGTWLCYVIKLLLFIVSFPFVCLFSWTIPDCSKEHNRKWFLASFILSVLWIAVLSVGMVTLVSRCGCILGIDNYTMGLVVVAIGTSVPDALSSILVARDGYGDMAVSNAIGSNVFDIDLGLGLPFIIRNLISGPITLLGPLDTCLMNNGELVMTQHSKFGFILMFILILTIITFGAARFKLNRGIGVTFVFIYFLFLAYAFVQEFHCRGVYC